MIAAILITTKAEQSALRAANLDLDTAIGGTTGSGVVAGDRVTLSVAAGIQAQITHPGRRQIARHTDSSTFGQLLVVLKGPGRVGKAFDRHLGTVKFHQHLADGVQHRIEGRRHPVAVSGKGDVTRHDQADIIARTLNTHTRAFQLLTQLHLLLVHIVADATTDSTTDGCAGQCTLAAIIIVDRRTQHRTCQRTYTGTLGGVGGFGLLSVGVQRGTTAQHQRTHGCCQHQFFHTSLLNSDTRLLHGTGKRRLFNPE